MGEVMRILFISNFICSFLNVSLTKLASSLIHGKVARHLIVGHGAELASYTPFLLGLTIPGPVRFERLVVVLLAHQLFCRMLSLDVVS